ncbi:MAG: ATP-binding protein [Cyanobacteriota bacterium]|nr:ATP-binding protein [Cyanobacteriota bacterium]
MGRRREISFRRFLLLRLVLLSVPVLIIGALTYRKARSGLLETARQNLTESAVRKGLSVKDSLEAIQANLLTASETSSMESASPEELSLFLERLAPRLPSKVRCLELKDVQTDRIIATTCDRTLPAAVPENFWPARVRLENIDESLVYVQTVFSGSEALETRRQLSLVMSAPVYGRASERGLKPLRYALSFETGLSQSEAVNKPGSLAGYTVIIDESGTILEHPFANRVGSNISQEEDLDRFQSLMRNAIDGRQDFLHLFYFDDDREELIAGYTAIDSPVTDNPDSQWVVLAVTRLESALSGRGEIKQVIFTLVVGLFAVNLLATLYIGRDLAHQVEELGEYALNVQCSSSAQTIPSNFAIREFNQLSGALNIMVERLKAWAEELEAAWREAKQANQLKSEFLTTISHELRTPLNGILGSIRLVKDDCCDSPQEELEFLQTADDSAMRLLGIIDDILDISKIEAGQMPVTLKLVDLQKVLQETVALQRPAIEEKGLTLEVAPIEKPMVVQADAAKLTHVLFNAIDNALKFTDAGKISISTSIESISGANAEPDDPRDYRSNAIVRIQDTGIGIDPKHHHKLFQPFVMVDGSTTRKSGGTGLGLAISRNLMELMGGTISVRSAGTNRGTTVELSLPLSTHIPLVP